MKSGIKRWAAHSALFAFSFVACVRAKEAKGMDLDREMIGKVIETQGQLLIPEIKARLLKELDRPLVIGGGQRLLGEAAAAPSGWEVFANAHAIKAVLEFATDVAAGQQRQFVTAEVFARDDGKDVPKLVLVVVPLGPNATQADISKLKFSDKQLEQIGLKPAGAHAPAEPEHGSQPK